MQNSLESRLRSHKIALCSSLHCGTQLFKASKMEEQSRQEICSLVPAEPGCVVLEKSL